VAHRPTRCVGSIHDRGASSGAAAKMVMTSIGLRAKRGVRHAAPPHATASAPHATTNVDGVAGTRGRGDGGRRTVQRDGALGAPWGLLNATPGPRPSAKAGRDAGLL
jgi:hypothetical protein